MIFIYNHQKLQIIKPFLLLSKMNEECLLRDLVTCLLRDLTFRSEIPYLFMVS